MAAIAVFLLPRGILPNEAHELTRPYILWTSQWQKWDIFSPDPLRRVSSYAIEVRQGERWVAIRNIDTNSLPWYAHAKELKLLGRLEENWNKLTSGYLRYECASLPGLAGATLRLRAIWYVLPSDTYALKRFSHGKPTTNDKVLGAVQCSAAIQ